MFKLSLQLQKASQHLRGTTLNVTAVLATLVLLVVPRALAATTATNSCQLKSPKGAIQHVIAVRQHALPTGQPRRPLGSRADASPAQFHPGQRCTDVERPHRADLAHRDRHLDLTHRRLSR